ncbi:HlyD family secretion protein [Rubripirellula amarantea]|nr:HlyD family efflux transporter periplasmic adaptor subunit [Rubripirellula amarantea]
MNRNETMIASKSLRSLLSAFVAASLLTGTSARVGVASELDNRVDGLVSDGYTVEVDECLVRFAKEIQVPALATGRVDQVMVQKNDFVETGSPLARLDDRALLIRRRTAQLRVTSAREQSSDEVEIKYAEVALAEAQAELDNSRSIQNDVRGAIPLTQMRRMRLAVERGELEVTQAKKRKLRAELEVQLREADLSEIDDAIGHLHTDSPIDGIVLEITRAAGEWIETGETIAQIGKIDRLHVHALVRGDKLSPTQCRDLPVSVHWTDPSNGKNHSLRGHVLSVDPQTLPGGRFRVHAEIKNTRSSGSASDQHQSWLLTPGTPVSMKLYVPASDPRSDTRQREEVSQSQIRLGR